MSQYTWTMSAVQGQRQAYCNVDTLQYTTVSMVKMQESAVNQDVSDALSSAIKKIPLKQVLVQLSISCLY